MTEVAFVIAALAKTIIGTLVSFWGVSSDCPRQERFTVRVSVVIAFAVAYYVVRFVYVSHFYVEGPLMVCLMTAAVALALFRYSRTYALYVGCAVSLCLQASQLAAFAIAGTLIGDIDEVLAVDPWVGVLVDGLGAVVSLPAVAFIRWQAREGARFWIRGSHLATLIVPLVLFLFFSAWQMPSFDTRYHALEIAPLALIAIVFLAVVFSILTLFALFRIAWQRTEIDRLETLAVDRYDHLMLREEEGEELRQLMHDLRNHLLCIQETDDPMARQEHFTQLESHLTELRHTRFTGNPTIDALLNQKRREAQRLGIDYHVAPLAVSPVFMNSMDICALWGNAIDNAIESCQREEDAEGFIDIKMGRVGGYLSVVVVNTCGKAPVKRERGFVSAKRSGDDQGVGVASMIHIVEKYEGMLDFSWADGEFTTTILIPYSVEPALM